MCKRLTHTHPHIYIRTYIFGCMYRTSPPNGRTYTQGPRASECQQVCPRARIGGAAAHNPPRRTEARPSASAIVRAAGPGAVHTPAMFDTDVVFHAPMFALNTDAPQNACAPKPNAVDADGQRLARFRVSGSGRARSTSPPTRPHTADPSPSLTGARTHNPDRF
jgi:hypothetical protein